VLRVAWYWDDGGSATNDLMVAVGSTLLFLYLSPYGALWLALLISLLLLEL